MSLKKSMLFTGAIIFCMAYTSAQAETAPTRLTEAQMKAIHDCAAAKGVEFPPPPPKMVHNNGEKFNEHPSGPPPKDRKDGESKGPHGPRLTDEQRAIIDSCFAEQGLTPPPKARPDHNK